MPPHQFNKYEFELHLSSVSGMDSSVADALLEAGCDDALLHSAGDKTSLTFSREAASFRDAILSAISDVNSANINARVLSVETNDFANSEELKLINEMICLFCPVAK